MTEEFAPHPAIDLMNQDNVFLALEELGIAHMQHCWILANAPEHEDAAAVAEKVTRGEIRGSEAVEEILAYMQEQYGGLSEQMAGTYAGMVDNLADAEANAEAAYGEGYNEKRKEGIQAQMDWLNSGVMDEANRAIGAWQAELEKLH